MKERLKPYLNALPDIFIYQIVTKLMLSFSMFVLGRIFFALLKDSGRVAITSGDWKFLFTTWQGILILILLIAVLFMYVAVDINGKIELSGRLVRGDEVSLKECITIGFNSTGRIFNFKGLLIVLYLTLIAPILGFGFSISITKGLYIPTFISSFIADSVLYSGLGAIAVLILIYIGISNLFILHGIVLDGLSVPAAGKLSGKLIRDNWKNYFKENIRFILVIFVCVVFNAVVILLIPLKIIQLIAMPAALSRFLTICFVTAGALTYVLLGILMIPIYLMKMTQLFYSYKQGSPYEYYVSEEKGHPFDRRFAALALAAFLVVDVLMYINFDSWFPAEVRPKIIAHRAGGIEAPENTIAGLETAYRLGAYGCEIDIQRTKDGHYVLNHDGTFERTAGDKRKPENMTLAEVKALSVDGEPVPDFEEVLQACKGKLVLFTELKGNTADKKMADDAVRLIKKYGMEDECVLISLKYDLIDYIETEYPDIQTGFLAFASFGRTEDLNCDYIGLEEESATAYNITSIHGRDKKVLVWTVNGKREQKYFFSTDADGIITDKIAQAASVATSMRSRSDLERMTDRIKTFLASTM